MRISIRIINNHLRQRVPCIVFNVENNKYIINTPETLQRFAKENGVKFTSNMNFFFTNLSSHHIMGLVGLLLTLYEHDHHSGCRLFGPSNIGPYLRGIRHILGTKIFAYSAACYDLNS